MYKPIPNVHVIGLGHKARNGKDTVASVIQSFFGAMARRYAFADGLRTICRVVYGMEGKDAPLLQTAGTEIFRCGLKEATTTTGRIIKHPGVAKPDPEIWARTTYWTIKEHEPLIAIISDVRFPNEADMVKQMGGTLIHCIRRTRNGKQYIDPSRDKNHYSETALDNYDGWDVTLDAGSVEHLEYQAVSVCERLAEEIGYHELQY